MCVYVLEDQEIHSKKMSSGYVRAIELMLSWLPVQGLHKIGHFHLSLYVSPHMSLRDNWP